MNDKPDGSWTGSIRPASAANAANAASVVAGPSEVDAEILFSCVN